MADKKSKKKEKKQVLSLAEFQSAKSDKPNDLNWADDLEDSLRNTGMKPLPDAPRSLLEPDLNLDTIPLHGPFLLALENAPFELTEEQLIKFFQPIPLKEFTLQIEIGRRKLPQVEFETRDHLIRAMKEKHGQDLSRRAVKLKNPEDLIREANSRRDGGYGNRRDQDGGGYGGQGLDPNRPENAPMGNWRDNAPSLPPPPSGPRQGGFDSMAAGSGQFDRSQMAPFAGQGGPSSAPQSNDRRGQGPPRDVNFQIQRNMDIQYTEGSRPQFDTLPRQPMRHDMEDRPFVRQEYRPDDEPPRSGHFSRPPPPAAAGGSITPYGPLPPSFGDHRQNQQQRRPDNYRGDVDFVRRPDIPMPDSRPAPPPAPHHFHDSRPGDVRIERSSFIPEPQPLVQPTPQPPPVPVTTGPRERPKLVLEPKKETAAAQSQPVASSAIFGGARPVDTSAREREMDEKLRKDRETAEADRLRRLEESVVKVTPAAAPDFVRSDSTSSDSVTRKLAAVSIAGSKPMDNRPVASVPPFNSQVSRPEEPSRQSHHQTGKEYYSGSQQHSSDIRKLQPQLSTASSTHSGASKPEERDFGEDDDRSQTSSNGDGFQTVGKRQRAGGSTGYNTRVFNNSRHAARGGGTRPPYGAGRGSHYGPPDSSNGGGGAFRAGAGGRPPVDARRSQGEPPRHRGMS